MKAYGQDVNFKLHIESTGNWNYKADTKEDTRAKKMLAVVTIKDLPTYWTHEEVFNLLECFLEVDKLNIDLINSKFYNTGEVKAPEACFIDKLEAWLNEKKKNKE